MLPALALVLTMVSPLKSARYRFHHFHCHRLLQLLLPLLLFLNLLLLLLRYYWSLILQPLTSRWLQLEEEAFGQTLESQTQWFRSTRRTPDASKQSNVQLEQINEKVIDKTLRVHELRRKGLSNSIHTGGSGGGGGFGFFKIDVSGAGSGEGSSPTFL